MDFKVITSRELDVITGMIEQLSTDMRDAVKKASNPLEEKWLDNQDASRVLKVGTRTLQNYRDNGTLAFSTIGGKVFYKASDIESVLHENYTSRG